MKLSTVHISLYFLLFVFSHQAADFKEMAKNISLLPQELQLFVIPGYAPVITYTHVHKKIDPAENKRNEYPLLPSSLASSLKVLKGDFSASNQNTYVANGVRYVDYNIPKLEVSSKYELLQTNVHSEGRHYHDQYIQKGTYCLFDGYNKNGSGIILRSRDSKTYVLMVSEKMCRNYSHKDKNTAILDQTFCSLALHDDTDCVMLCTELHPDTHSSTLQLFNFKYNHTDPCNEKTQLTELASAQIPFTCKKLAHLDKGMCVAITDTGDFKIIEHTDETFKIHNQKHPNILFKSIAVNKDHTNLAQGKFRCALLADTGELYIADLWNLKKPTLLYAYTIPDVHLVHNMYYKDDELSIVYRDAEDMQLITKMDVYKDKYHFLWLCSFMNQYADKILRHESVADSCGVSC